MPVDDLIELSADRARAGETGHGVRFVLLVGLLLALGAMIIAALVA